MPLLRQAEAAECGLACVGMIAGYHGFQVDLPTLRRDFPISLKGATLADVIQIAAGMNFGSRALRCELSELKNLRTPAILHWKMSHFVVLKKATSRRVEIFDPALGRQSFQMEDISDQFTGVALELTPTSNFVKKRERNPIRLTSLVRLSGESWKALGQGVLLSLFLQIFVLLTPYYMQLVIDDAILKGNLNFLTAIATGFGVLALFEMLTGVLRGLVFQFLSNVVAFDMEASLLHHMVRLPLSYFHRRHTGDIQQRFQSLLPIRDFVVNGAIAALLDGVLAIFIGVILFMYDFYLGLTVLAVVILYALARLSFLEISKKLAGNLLVAEAKENTKFLETLRAMQTIKVSGAEVERENLWRNLAAETLNAQIRVGNVNIGYQALNKFLMAGSNVLIVYLAAQSIFQSEMTIGMLTAIMAYKGQFEGRLTTLLDQWVAFKLLDVHLERVSDIGLTEQEQHLKTQGMNKPLDGKIEVRKLMFRYAPHEKEVLRNINLKIEPGEFVAICGPSGSGKSTLMRLLVGLYQPSYGEVLFDGYPVSSWGLSNLRRQIGVVMQDDTLLAGSIEENISLFDDRPDHDTIRWAAKLAQIDEDIQNMPMGYKSLVGDMGSSLSGGQQQRVMIARALYRRPKLLVMDESTSALDITREQNLNQALKELTMTRIVAAHRPETLRAADRVVVLEGGTLNSPFAQNVENRDNTNRFSIDLS
ncbi:MAG: hypothetical protein CMK04_10245 [Ponticaulis sp.]|nr:hypothetical protein [Ponticaulis sp.]|tara:strand:+ start:42367 stop:44481 length:2115 start_codon:yes stop_codon:yes gene_type:complete